MTREEVMILDMEGCEERAAKIAEETREASEEILAELSAELDMIEERKAIITAEAEEKRAAMEAVLEGSGEVIEEKEERKIMDNMEIRKSPEYLDAWVEYQKGKANEEQRTLLTEIAPTGTIAVPTYVEDKVNTAWENNEIMRRVKKSYFSGMVRVPAEISASGAVVHEEGGEAISEEELVLEFVSIVPQTIKKMVKFTTEVMDLKGTAFIDYIFDEIEYQIVKMAGFGVLGTINDSSLASTVSGTAAGLATADIIAAQGSLGGEASDPVLIISRAEAAALKAAALSANYAYDPFDGLPVIYVDAAILTSMGVYGFVADLSGVQVNFPKGDTPTFVFDEYTEAPADVVRVIGRLMAGFGVVATGKCVTIMDPNA